MNEVTVKSLLGPADPKPVEVIESGKDSDIVLLCEHAGRAIPRALGTLGINDEVLNSHRGWDIGAENVARLLASEINAPLVLQSYSRLVIDCNRPPGSPTSIPPISDNEKIPGNKDADDTERKARVREIFDPMNRVLGEIISSQKPCAVFSIHSFTPRMNGKERPWHAGFLTRTSVETARALMENINSREPGLVLALNQPYQISDETDWFIPRYAEKFNLPHSLVEIRNDQIDSTGGANFWAGLLAEAISGFMESRG